MDPIIGGALISGASSLLGGIFGKPKNEYVVPNYQKIRNKAEAAGFNPLTALAMAPGQVVQSQNFMGSAIADAGLALADGLNTKRKEQGALAKLAEENDKLREKVQNMTLRPKVPGVYAQREAIPSVSQAVGGSSGSANAAANSGDSAGNLTASVGVSAQASQPSSSSDDASKTPTRPLQILGISLKPQSKTSDTEAFASRYGEDFLSPSWFAGWGGFIGDAALGIKDYAAYRGGIISDAFQADRKAWKDHPKKMQNLLGQDWWKHQAPGQ